MMTKTNEIANEIAKAWDNLLNGNRPALVFYVSGGPYGDETCSFDVKCNVKYVKEVIAFILTQNEWGTVSIRKNGLTRDFEYKRDTIDDIPSELLEKKVKKITSHGGWGRMDYTIL